MRVTLGQQVFLIFLGLVIIYGLWLVINTIAIPRMSPYKISIEKAKSLINNNYVDVIIDVRSPQEIKITGALPGSVNIPIEKLEYIVPSNYPDKNTRILVYCRKGIRANKATDKLRSMGYKSVYFITESYENLL